MNGEKVALHGAQETLLITLCAKAGESRLPDSLLKDRFAAEALARIDYDFDRLKIDRDMMIGIERQIAFLSERVELMPGDVICTGSPYGNGSAFGVFLQPGDVMEGTITGLGTQRNACVAES